MKIPILIEATEDQRFRATGGGPFASSVEADTPKAALDEMKTGTALLRRAKTARQLVPVYQRMQDTIRFLSSLPILPFTEAAAARYEELRRTWPRRSRMDLRIGAVAMAYDAVLVTRNLRDFRSIEDLAVVDWSQN